MKAEEIVNQLKVKLPTLVDDFTNNFSVTSLTRSGTTVTAVTSTDHNLSIGRAVNITGAKTPLGISSLTRSGMVGTLITDEAHDFTTGEGDQTIVEITGATEAEFNGDFTILSVPNRKTVTFQMTDSGPTVATGSPLVLNGTNVFQTYNGLREVTSVPTSTSFTYEITDSTLFTPADGTINAKTNPRISSEVTIDDAIKAYTAQPNDDAWLFVVLGGTIASKNRNLDIDSTDNIQRGNFYKQHATKSVSLYVFLPSSAHLAGRKQRDRCEELLQPICQSILFKKFDPLIATGPYNPLMFAESDIQGYNGAIYIHRYTFELTLYFSFEDTVGYDEDVAYRDMELIQKFSHGTEAMTTDIDLDDEPLP